MGGTLTRGVTVRSLATPAVLTKLKAGSWSDPRLSSLLIDVVSRLSVNGTVRDIRPATASTKPVIVYIQDVHGQPEAQKNIAAMMLSLLEAKPDAIVGLEGSADPISLDPFRRASPLINKEIGSFFLNTGLITGAEYAGFAAPASPRLVGIEDADLYLKNVAAIREAAPLRADRLKTIEAEKRDLQVRKLSVYSPDMLALDQAWRNYHDGSDGVGDYLTALAAHDRPSLNRFPAVALFLETLSLEKSLDIARAERERQHVLSRLVERLSKAELDRLIERSVALRSGALSYPAYYAMLRDLAGRAGVDLSKTPTFDRYVTYVLKADAIQPEAFLSQMAAYEKAVWEKLCGTGDQRELYQAAARWLLTEKLVRLEMTSSEWNEYKRRRTGGEWAAFESFYEVAEARDAAMAANFLDIIARRLTSPAGRRADLVVLVAGGFHSDGLKRLLSEAGATVVTVSPKLADVAAGSHQEYLSVFTREKTPLEKLFEAPSISIPKTLATGSIGDNPTARVVARLAALLTVPVGLAVAKGSGMIESGRVAIGAAMPGADFPALAGDLMTEGVTESGLRIAVHAGEPLRAGLFDFLPPLLAQQQNLDLLLVGLAVFALLAAGFLFDLKRLLDQEAEDRRSADEEDEERPEGNQKPETHHLPFYLWRPYAAALQDAVGRRRLGPEIHRRIVEQGLGTARIDNQGQIAIEEEALPVLAEVLNRELGRQEEDRLTVDHVRAFLRRHESVHQVLSTRRSIVKRVLNRLKTDSTLYPYGFGVRDFAALKEMFVNNFGEEFRSDDRFVEELLVVAVTEQSFLNQRFLLPAGADPRTGRVPLPNGVAAVLNEAVTEVSKGLQEPPGTGLTRREILRMSAATALKAALPGWNVLSPSSLERAQEMLSRAWVPWDRAEIDWLLKADTSPYLFPDDTTRRKMEKRMGRTLEEFLATDPQVTVTPRFIIEGLLEGRLTAAEILRSLGARQDTPVDVSRSTSETERPIESEEKNLPTDAEAGEGQQAVERAKAMMREEVLSLVNALQSGEAPVHDRGLFSIRAVSGRTIEIYKDLPEPWQEVDGLLLVSRLIESQNADIRALAARVFTVPVYAASLTVEHVRLLSVQMADDTPVHLLGETVSDPNPSTVGEQAAVTLASLLANNGLANSQELVFSVLEQIETDAVGPSGAVMDERISSLIGLAIEMESAPHLSGEEAWFRLMSLAPVPRQTDEEKADQTGDSDDGQSKSKTLFGTLLAILLFGAQGAAAGPGSQPLPVLPAPAVAERPNDVGLYAAAAGPRGQVAVKMFRPEAPKNKALYERGAATWRFLPAAQRAPWDDWREETDGASYIRHHSVENLFGVAHAVYHQDWYEFDRTTQAWGLPDSLRAGLILGTADNGNVPIYLDGKLAGHYTTMNRQNPEAFLDGLDRAVDAISLERALADETLSNEALLQAFDDYGPMAHLGLKGEWKNLRDILRAFRTVFEKNEDLGNRLEIFRIGIGVRLPEWPGRVRTPREIVRGSPALPGKIDVDGILVSVTGEATAKELVAILSQATDQARVLGYGGLVNRLNFALNVSVNFNPYYSALPADRKAEADRRLKALRGRLPTEKEVSQWRDAELAPEQFKKIEKRIEELDRDFLEWSRDLQTIPPAVAEKPERDAPGSKKILEPQSGRGSREGLGASAHDEASEQALYYLLPSLAALMTGIALFVGGADGWAAFQGAVTAGRAGLLATLAVFLPVHYYRVVLDPTNRAYFEDNGDWSPRLVADYLLRYLPLRHLMFGLVTIGVTLLPFLVLLANPTRLEFLGILIGAGLVFWGFAQNAGIGIHEINNERWKWRGVLGASAGVGSAPTDSEGVPLKPAHAAFIQEVVGPIFGGVPSDMTITQGDLPGDEGTFLGFSHEAVEPWNGTTIAFQYQINFTGADIVVDDIVALNEWNHMDVPVPPAGGWSEDQIATMRHGFRQLIVADPNNPRFSREVHLLDYQEEAVEKIEKMLKASDKALAVMATATGKTVVAFTLADRLMADLPSPSEGEERPAVVFIVNNNFILEQAEVLLNRMFPGKYATGQIFGGRENFSGDFIFATPGSLAGGTNGQSRLETLVKKRRIAAVIFDETHHVVAAGNKEIFQRIEYASLENDWGTRFVGFTATESRPDRISVIRMFENDIAFEYPIKRARSEGALVPPVYINGDYDMNPDNAGPIIEGHPLYQYYREHMYADDRMPFLKRMYLEHANRVLDRRGLILAPNVERARAMAAVMSAAQSANGGSALPAVPAVSLTAADRTNDPRRFEHSYYAWKNGQWPVGVAELGQAPGQESPFKDEPVPQVVVGVDIFKEGVDVPAINIVILWANTNSSIEFLQSIGRGLRLAPFKTRLIVIDAVGLFRKLSLLRVLGNFFRPTEKGSGGKTRRAVAATGPEEERELSSEDVTEVFYRWANDIPSSLVDRWPTYGEVPRRELINALEPYLARRTGFLPEEDLITDEQKADGVRAMKAWLAQTADRLVQGSITAPEVKNARRRLMPAFYAQFPIDDFDAPYFDYMQDAEAPPQRLVFDHFFFLMAQERPDDAPLLAEHAWRLFPEYNEENRRLIQVRAENLKSLRLRVFQRSRVAMADELIEQVRKTDRLFDDPRGIGGISRVDAWAADDRLHSLQAARDKTSQYVHDDFEEAVDRYFDQFEGRGKAVGRTDEGRVFAVSSKERFYGVTDDQKGAILMYLVHPDIARTGLKKEHFDLPHDQFIEQLRLFGLLPDDGFTFRQYVNRLQKYIAEYVEAFDGGDAGLREAAAEMLIQLTTQPSHLALLEEERVGDQTAAKLLRLASEVDRVLGALGESAGDKDRAVRAGIEQVLRLLGVRFRIDVEELPGVHVVLRRESVQQNRWAVELVLEPVAMKLVGGPLTLSSTFLNLFVRADGGGRPHVIIPSHQTSDVQAFYDRLPPALRPEFLDGLVSLLDVMHRQAGGGAVFVLPEDAVPFWSWRVTSQPASFFSDLFDHLLANTEKDVLGQIGNLSETGGTGRNRFTIEGLARSRLSFLTPSEIAANRRYIQGTGRARSHGAIGDDLDYLYRILGTHRLFIQPQWPAIEAALGAYEPADPIDAEVHHFLLESIRDQVSRDVTGTKRMLALRRAFEAIFPAGADEVPPLTPSAIRRAAMIWVIALSQTRSFFFADKSDWQAFIALRAVVMNLRDLERTADSREFNATSLLEETDQLIERAFRAGLLEKQLKDPQFQNAARALKEKIDDAKRRMALHGDNGKNGRTQQPAPVPADEVPDGWLAALPYEEPTQHEGPFFVRAEDGSLQPLLFEVDGFVVSRLADLPGRAFRVIDPQNLGDLPARIESGDLKVSRYLPQDPNQWTSLADRYLHPEARVLHTKDQGGSPALALTYDPPAEFPYEPPPVDREPPFFIQRENGKIELLLIETVDGELLASPHLLDGRKFTLLSVAEAVDKVDEGDLEAPYGLPDSGAWKMLAGDYKGEMSERLLKKKPEGGALWIDANWYRPLASFVELLRNVPLALYLVAIRSEAYQTWLDALSPGWGLFVSAGGALLAMASIPLLFKYAHLPGRGEETYTDPAIRHLTRLFAWTTLPLLALPFVSDSLLAHAAVLLVYAAVLAPFTYHHWRVDNPKGVDITSAADQRRAQLSVEAKALFIAALAGELQDKLLEKGSDFREAKAILAGRLASQVETIREDAAQVSDPTSIRFEFDNAFYLAGRAGLSWSDARSILGPVLTEVNAGKVSAAMRLEWARGRFVQSVLDAVVPVRRPFYATRSAENLKAGIVNAFHVDALVNSSFDETLREQTLDHLRQRMDTWDGEKERGREDILIVRYQPSDDASEDQKRIEEAEAKVWTALLKVDGLLALPYLERAIIVPVPANRLIRPSDVLTLAREKARNPGRIEGARLDLYTATPDLIDMNDSLVRFIVYSLLAGLRVRPVSTLVEEARVVSINA